MHKKLIMACMAIAAFAAFVIAPAASASPVLTHGATTVAVGTKIVGTNTENTKFEGSGLTVTCSKAVLTGTLLENSGTLIQANVLAGNVSFTGTSGTGTECASNLFGQPAAVSVNSQLCLGTVSKTDNVSITGCSGKNVAFTLNITGSGPCKYEQSTITGTYKTGATATVNLAAATATLAEGGFFCPGTGALTMDFDLYTDDNQHKTPLTIS